MTIKIGISKVLTGLLLLLVLAPMAFAQDTTSTIRGTVLASDGSPAANSPVTITDTRTGKKRSMTTTGTGNFTAAGLSVGGPYTVQVGSKSVTDIFVNLGSTYTFTVTIESGVTEEVIVTGAALRGAPVAVGPASSYTLDDLQNAPAINRDIRDLIRIDPRIYIDEADVDGIQCNGASSRFNSITVDGIKLNDNFGLNRSGYPTERMPFPYAAIENVAVELAPFDVQYGGFTACNVNAVTKSGTNEYTGEVFIDYTDDGLKGHKLEGDRIPAGDFDEKRYGVAVGGPIIKDKLFFFGAYQKDETSRAFDRCAGDATCGRPVAGVTQAQLDRIGNIARTMYNYEPGALLTNLPIEDEKYLIKFDWNINDQHRANFTYDYNDGATPSQSDGDDDEFEFSNHYYNRGAELDAYSASLFSDWSDRLTTEFRIGNATLDNRQVTINGVGFPEFRIETYGPTGARANVYLGGDDSRQSNKLDYESNTLKLAGSYTLNNHTISGGFETEELEIANLFLQHSIGEYRFDEMCNSGNPDGCIDALEALSPDDIYYGNAAGTNNPLDAAGALKYSINSLYVQDELLLPANNMTLVFGLRWDFYDSSDLPTANANFMARNGFTNSTNFDGEGLIQPRFGITWDVMDRLSLRGGIGLYSGGNPNVWLTNNYQVDGVTQVQLREFNVGLSGLNSDPTMSLATIPLSGAGRPGYDIPQAFIDAVTTGSANSSVNAMDPNFKIPSQWKFALGGTWDFDLPGNWGSDYQLSADLMLTKSQDSALIRDATLEQIDTTVDGRPVYRSIDRSDPGCAVDPSDSGICSGRGFNQDFILGNVSGSDAEQTAFSVVLSKAYDNGINWAFAYAHVEAEDVSPMTSSVAFSNFANGAVSDPNNPGLATSNYLIGDRFTLNLGWTGSLWRDLDTRVTVFGSANEGRPFSYVFANDDGDIFGDLIDRRHLLYMPSGPSDPNVRFDPGFDQAAFFAFAAQSGLTGYGGGIVPRNEFNSSWWTKFDLRVSQELPGFRENDRAQAYLVIENFGNLLNEDWGVLKEASFPRMQDIVDADYDFGTNQYVFENFIPADGQGRATSASIWALRMGFKYSF